MEIILEFFKRSVTGRTWELPQINQARLSEFQSQLNSTELVARILFNRGIDTPDKATAFFSHTLAALMPNPSRLQDVDKAVDRITQGLKRNEKIYIWGDYDVDGTVSVSLFIRFFRSIGYNNVSFYIPDRLTEGYGLNYQGLTKIKSGGSSLVISVDCGTGNIKEAEFARDSGIEMIIIDHHKVGDTAPYSSAFINPQRPDRPEQDLKDLCSAGLVFMVLIAINRKLRSENFYKDRLLTEPDLKEYFGMLSLATVCDVMRLTGLNRAYVFHGLKMLREKKDRRLTCLAEAAGLENIESAGHLGFILGPRINAAGRVGDNSALAVDFFISEIPNEVCDLAKKLSQINDKRKEIENQNLALAEGVLTDKKYILISDENMHPGIIGIVASRLKEKYNKPSFIISLCKDICKGSARSVDGIDIGSVIQKAVNEGILSNGGGHKMAAGFSVHAGAINKFEKFLDDVFADFKSADPTVKIDGFLSLSALNERLFSDILKLEPFGVGNPAPRFMFPRLIAIRIEVLKEKHIRCVLADESGKTILGYLFNGMETSLGEYMLHLNVGKRVDVLGAAKCDFWKGKKQIKILIEDLADAEP
ncbi:MAG: single-stranded-DNA-specific exonuclease RecJ [Holosporales bacterium]|jgi:single-stranded-DNA-specific exonuclease|nr:single-stranded-DNA-specific exonuclease RecJ [Holosporales bacterium]